MGVILAIVGSRAWRDKAVLFAAADKLNPAGVVSGGAQGADALAEEYARERGLPLVVYRPDLARYGSPAAYHIRNRQIAEACDQVLACMAGTSRGTESTIKAARRLGKPVHQVYVNQGLGRPTR